MHMIHLHGCVQLFTSSNAVHAFVDVRVCLRVCVCVCACVCTCVREHLPLTDWEGIDNLYISEMEYIKIQGKSFRLNHYKVLKASFHMCTNV